jgi:hypothetical protein
MNKNNHDSDDESYDSDDYNDDVKDNDIEDNVQEEIAKIEKMVEKINTNEKVNITTEGVSQENVPNVKLYKLKNVRQCNFCAKWFHQELIVNNEEGQLCKHCLFWINYDESNRLNFDKKCAEQGFGIAEYILECSELHDSNKCLRKGGCFLCDFKTGTPILKILNSEMLPQQIKKSSYEEHSDAKFCYDMERPDFRIPLKLVL